MPIFEYRCDDCGTRFERLVRREADGNGILCPSCGDTKVTRQLSVFAAHSGGSTARAAEPTPGGCPSGMCATPGFCGRN